MEGDSMKVELPKHAESIVKGLMDEKGWTINYTLDFVIRLGFSYLNWIAMDEQGLLADDSE